MGYKIAIISDTHSLLRPEVEESISKCDYILHGGDIASEDTYERIKSLAPSYFVRGNADKDWAIRIPSELDIELAGYRFYMIHNIKHAKADLSRFDFVVYGHSHKYENRQIGDTTYLNPGSCGPRRFTQPVTMMLMTVEDNGSFTIEKKDLSPFLKRGTKLPPQKEMDKVIRGIVKDMKASRTVEQISRHNRVEEKLVLEILQIYTTHPGIDTDGILDRLSITKGK